MFKFNAALTYLLLASSLHSVPLAIHNGELAPKFVSNYITTIVVSNTGTNPEGFDENRVGYWTSAADTPLTTSNTNIYSSFTYTV